MKLKNFSDYLAQRLDTHEIDEIKQQAVLEFQAFHALQRDVATAVNDYMASQQIGFNELVKRLGTSASQTLKIQRGEANLTLASIAHIAALLKLKPQIVFRDLG